MRHGFVRFYARWFSPEGYLGLHLVVGFLLALAGGYWFGVTAEDVFGTSTPALHIDTAAEAYAERINGPALTFIMRAVSFAGSLPTVFLASLAVSGILYFSHSRRRFYCFVSIVGGGALLAFVLKEIFHRARPALPHLAHATGFSFPSGHAMMSVLFFSGLAYVLFFTVESKTWHRAAALLLCALAALLIGSSRVYLGVHYLSDVIGGYTGGLCWVGICITGTETWVRLRDWRAGRRANLADPSCPS